MCDILAGPNSGSVGIGVGFKS